MFCFVVMTDTDQPSDSGDTVSFTTVYWSSEVTDDTVIFIVTTTCTTHRRPTNLLLRTRSVKTKLRVS